ncbi:hypothetical protein, conserved [Trypanosoma brucei gambiense DAL972]|uniref:Uncharacterized protein n=1 Tax=Trypanosoma brucei gambiense (strain MHOM/CI/86/DAL972) TaxID=679716 RepID=D0A5E3_TRYB9|nr:hypothetical protein, conserved [Trypanosoma brucei gambiense DAL972]CBH16894.1 hypothetical protein, conserved [Trypanosoma brucei gambiense DAL972]|eukprot:XP_011779158.1 hypothetical protein, conserved [Trypanosoma brucei gambiense DAL972]
MIEADVIRLNMEVEAAAARNADLSREVARLTEELANSGLHNMERTLVITEGTQTDSSMLREVALDLDDILFEVSELLFRLYPASSLDLSVRRDAQSSQLNDLSQRCLREVRSLKAAWEMKLDGYNQFISNIQRSQVDYHRSLDSKESQLRRKQQECDVLVGENARLSTLCSELESQLKTTQEAATRAEEQVGRLLQQTADLEAERRRLLDREAAMANTLVALRAECAFNPWSSLVGVKEAATTIESNGQLPSVREQAVAVTKAHIKPPGAVSAPDLAMAFQGLDLDGQLPHMCVEPESVVDYYCKVKHSSPTRSLM